MLSMILAQTSEEPLLLSVFREMFSEEGNELYFKPAYEFIEDFDKEISVIDLRTLAINAGCVFLGYIKGSSKNMVINPKFDTMLKINENDKLLVFCRD